MFDIKCVKCSSSAMLLSLTRTPPGGWMYRQPETGWEIPDPLAGDINDNARKIMRHREANPRFKFSTEFDDCKAELIATTCVRLRWDVKWCHPGGPMLEKKVLSRPPHPAESAAAGVKHIAAGIGLLVDWLGHGAKPVEEQDAEARADICSGCPLNQPGDWKAKFTVPVANKLLGQLEMRRQMKLSTKADEKLNVCAACDCPLKLKVHVPMDYIREYTLAEVIQKLDPRCWMLK